MVWSQVVVTVKQMLMAVVVIGARMDSGTLMSRILKVVNVRINSLLIVNCKTKLEEQKFYICVLREIYINCLYSGR
jgi:hypothetical protein